MNLACHKQSLLRAAMRCLLLWVVWFIGSPIHSLASYTYLPNARLISQVAYKQNGASRMTTAKAYDFLNRLQSVSSTPASSASMPLSAAYLYNQANQRTRARQWDNSYWAYEYDDLGQVISGKKHFADDTLVPGLQNEYAFDDIGNRTSAKSGGDEHGLNLRSSSYAANNVNQYSSRTNPPNYEVTGLAATGATVSVNSDSSGVFRKEQFFRKELAVSNNTYPAITVQAVSGASSTTESGYAFIPPATESFTHDTDGNLTLDGRWTYTWDGENRLIELKPNTNAPSASKLWLTMSYDSFGRRLNKAVKSWNGSAWSLVSSNNFVYDGWNLLAELDGLNLNHPVRTYIWGLDLSGSMRGAGGVGGLIAVRTNNIAHFAVYDGAGNVVGLVDGSTGTIAGNYDYDPFGITVRADGNAVATTNPFRFSSKYTDLESDFSYYGYRYYNPATGRWLNRDPIGEVGGIAINNFAQNNGLSFVDVDGLLLIGVASGSSTVTSGTMSRGVQGIVGNAPTLSLANAMGPAALGIAAGLSFEAAGLHGDIINLEAEIVDGERLTYQLEKQLERKLQRGSNFELQNGEWIDQWGNVRDRWGNIVRDKYGNCAEGNWGVKLSQLGGNTIYGEIPGIGRIHARNWTEVLWIEMIYVNPASRGRGNGTRLYRALLNIFPDVREVRGEPGGENLSALNRTGDINQTPRARALSQLGFTMHEYDAVNNIMISRKP